MALTTRLALALAASFALLPAAAAAPAHDTEGHLRMPDGVTLLGRLGLRGPGLFEAERSGGDAGVGVGFAALAEGRLVDRARDRVHVGLPGLHEPSFSDPVTTETPIAAEGKGRVENVRCGPQCRIAIAAAPGEGLVGAQGLVDATLRPTLHERVFTSANISQVESEQWTYVVPAGAVEAQAAQFAEAGPWASGRVTVVLVDAAFDLVAGGERATVDALWWKETTGEAAGHPVTVRHHSRHAELVLDGAALGLLRGEPFRLSFPTGADGLLEGVVSSADASGVLTVGGTQHGLDHDALELEGSLATRLSGRAPHALGGAPGLDVEVRGEVTRAVVSGANVTPWRPTGLAEAGGGLLALVGLAFLGRLFLVPLYHRLGPSDLLANPNRRRIHDAIRERPGVDMGSLVAAVGLSRILVRHHVRMLEAHKLVRATVWRRRRTYALAGALPAAASGLAACELKDPTRRRVAAAVARSGGATQKDLARALGLSQRLVSYHLACLGDSSLVRAEGRNPRVYVATPALAHALANEEALAHALHKEKGLAHGMGKEGEGAVAAVAAPA